MPLDKRRFFIERWQKRHGDESGIKLRRLVRLEWEKRR